MITQGGGIALQDMFLNQRGASNLHSELYKRGKNVEYYFKKLNIDTVLTRSLPMLIHEMTHNSAIELIISYI